MHLEARPPALHFRARRAVLPRGVRPASVRVEGGRIVRVGGYHDAAEGAAVVDAGDALLMPGLVDTHVHINGPGRDAWEGWETATRAAAAGGVATLVDMPLNSIPATTSLDGLRAKTDSARGRCWVDVGLWGGVVPGNEAELRPLWEAGVLGFKCFLPPSGVDEFGNVGEDDLHRAMPVLAKLGAPLLVHAEFPSALDDAGRAVAGEDPGRYATYLRSRPARAEVEAVELLVRLCRRYGTRVHVVHLATAEALPMLRAARAEGLPVTAESCPHYLTFAAEEIGDGALDLKCAPPIRGRAEREALWRALAAGDVELVASDHSPCPPAMKAGDWRTAWGGIASLELGLAAMWTGARARGIAPEQLAEWMSAAPARLAGLSARKGAISPGHDADLVVWDPDAETVAAPETLHQRHPVTPYAGARLAGAVRATYARGASVYEAGGFAGEPVGRILLRPQA